MCKTLSIVPDTWEGLDKLKLLLKRICLFCSRQPIHFFSISRLRTTTVIHKTALKVVESVSCSVVSNSLRPMDCSPLAPPSMGFSRQEDWSGLSFPSPGSMS